MKKAPQSRASANQRRGSGSRLRHARPVRTTIPSSTSQGRFQLPRHDPALGSSGRSVIHTPRHRETGRPRAAQFAPRVVYIPGGSATWCGRKARRMVTADLLSRARAGMARAFRELTDPHRRELQVHSLPDARDPSRTPRKPCGHAAGRLARHRRIHRGTRPGCAPGCTKSPPTGASTRRRAASLAARAKDWDVPNVEPPEPTRLDEVTWLEPFPDASNARVRSKAARAGGPLRADRSHHPGFRDRGAGPAAPPGRRPHLARRSRIPRQRGGAACWPR